MVLVLEVRAKPHRARAKIVETLLSGAPPQLETSQAFVGQIGPAEMQQRAPRFARARNRFPNHQITRRSSWKQHPTRRTVDRRAANSKTQRQQ